MNRLLLLATGGTIAGCAETSATLNNYTAGVLGGDALLAARMRPTSARQWANNRSALSTLATCSTLIAASPCSCGTAANRASPPSTPAV